MTSVWYALLNPVQQQCLRNRHKREHNMNSPTPAVPQNFDEWASLAATDLPAFETQRHHAIEAAIQQAPARNRQRLRCLQWKLDQIRSTARTPMIACLRMNRMLWETVAGDTGLLACLQYATGSAEHPHTGREATTAKIIPLRHHHAP
jgi:hypothetical protein